MAACFHLTIDRERDIAGRNSPVNVTVSRKALYSPIRGDDPRLLRASVSPWQVL